MSRDSEQILIELALLRLRSGDDRALNEVITYWHPKLLRHAVRLVERTDVAADVMQDAWLGIVKGLPRLQDPAAFAGWAHRIVANKAADWVKKQQRTRTAQRASAQREEEPPSDANAADEVDEVDDIRTAIRRLPPEQRVVIAMFYLDELSIADIAARLGLPSGTVKSRLHAARHQLKQILERNHYVRP